MVICSTFRVCMCGHADGIYILLVGYVVLNRFYIPLEVFGSVYLVFFLFIQSCVKYNNYSVTCISQIKICC